MFLSMRHAEMLLLGVCVITMATGTSSRAAKLTGSGSAAVCAGSQVPHSAGHSRCPPAALGAECQYTCAKGYFPIGRHVCQQQ